MPTPIPPNGYQIQPDNPTGKQFWQDTLDSLHGRLVDLRAEVDVTVAELGDDASALALALFTNSIEPQFTQLQADLATMAALIAERSEQLDAIEAGGVVAENVTVALIAGLVATDAQAALAELLAKINTSVTALQAQLDAIDFLPAARILLTTATTLKSGKRYRLATAGLTHTLPVAPAAGDTIEIEDGGIIGPGVVTLARNGKTIRDLAQDMTINVPGVRFSIWYTGTTWSLT